MHELHFSDNKKPALWSLVIMDSIPYRSPSEVSLCILPQVVPKEDPLVHITKTLMEAHCVEYGVRVLKVSHL